MHFMLYVPMLKHYWWPSQRASNRAVLRQYKENLWEIRSDLCWPWKCLSLVYSMHLNLANMLGDLGTVSMPRGGYVIAGGACPFHFQLGCLKSVVSYLRNLWNSRGKIWPGDGVWKGAESSRKLLIFLSGNDLLLSVWGHKPHFNKIIGSTCPMLLKIIAVGEYVCVFTLYNY